jgi:hypothetical protein
MNTFYVTVSGQNRVEVWDKKPVYNEECDGWLSEDGHGSGRKIDSGLLMLLATTPHDYEPHCWQIELANKMIS